MKSLNKEFKWSWKKSECEIHGMKHKDIATLSADLEPDGNMYAVVEHGCDKCFEIGRIRGGSQFCFDFSEPELLQWISEVDIPKKISRKIYWQLFNFAEANLV